MISLGAIVPKTLPIPYRRYNAYIEVPVIKLKNGPLGAAMGPVCMALFGCSDPQSGPVSPRGDTAVPAPASELSRAFALSVSLPAYRDPLVREWASYNSRCRDTTPDEAACQARDALTGEVEERGWCYGRGPGGGSDWMSCDEVPQDERPAEPDPKREAKLRFVRNDRYLDYELFLRPRDRVFGREVENRVMCRDMFEAAEENLWMLKNLAITRSEHGMTTFMGVRDTRSPALDGSVTLLDQQMLEVSFVRDPDRNVLSHLIVAGTVVGACEPDEA